MVEINPEYFHVIMTACCTPAISAQLKQVSLSIILSKDYLLMFANRQRKSAVNSYRKKKVKKRKKKSNLLQKKKDYRDMTVPIIFFFGFSLAADCLILR